MGDRVPEATIAVGLIADSDGSAGCDLASDSANVRNDSGRPTALELDPEMRRLVVVGMAATTIEAVPTADPPTCGRNIPCAGRARLPRKGRQKPWELTAAWPALVPADVFWKVTTAIAPAWL